MTNHYYPDEQRDFYPIEQVLITRRHKIPVHAVRLIELLRQREEIDCVTVSCTLRISYHAAYNALRALEKKGWLKVDGIMRRSPRSGRYRVIWRWTEKAPQSLYP